MPEGDNWRLDLSAAAVKTEGNGVVWTPESPESPMAIHFYCPLGHRLVVPDARAGKKGRCPACHQLVIAPVPNPQPSGKPKGPSPIEHHSPDFELDDVLSEQLGLKKRT